MLAHNTLEDMHKPTNSRAPMNKTEASRPEKSRLDRAEHPTLFGPPPLFDGEDTEIYDQLLKEISPAVTPADIFEDIWVRDVVDLTIEVLRLRRFKVKLMMTNAYKSLTETLSPLVGRSAASAFCAMTSSLARLVIQIGRTGTKS
jgi:hypothetical protein